MPHDISPRQDKIEATCVKFGSQYLHVYNAVAPECSKYVGYQAMLDDIFTQ